MAIPSELKLTLRGENFLAYDSGSDDRERFLILSTEQNLDLLESIPQWHGDGTFKCCSALFYQLYTVHGVLNGHTIPLVYMLLKRKARELYLRALNELKEINPCLQPSQITIDFEIASIENARNGNQKTNNNVECWHRAFQLGMGFAHPTITKFLQYLRKEQSFTEKRIARICAGEILPVNAKVERHRHRLQQLLNHYQNNNLLSVLEGLSFNFDF